MINQELKMIKDKYGEKMMHLCRSLFPGILDTEGLLFKILSEHFDYNKSLYDDIMEEDLINEFKDYIYSFVDVEEKRVITDKTPKELLEEAGYDFYECHTEDDIQSFSKYYEEDEIICTITFGGRLSRCYVFFAVKKDVDKIKRFNFPNPTRDDEYGTSVISIQFNREGANILSIKNRYNHTVNNPDATFGNNLENIIPGLTDAFEREYGLSILSNKREFSLDNYVLAQDGKFYKYNYEINNVYYCTNNIIIDNFQIKKYDKAKYIILDYYIIDKVNKTIENYDIGIRDSFIDSIGKIEKIEETIDKSTNQRAIIINNSIVITIDRNNRIIKYVNRNIEEVADDFMFYNKWLERIEIPKVKRIKDNFLRNNFSLKSFSSFELLDVGDSFLRYNFSIDSLDTPNLISVGDNFLRSAYLDSLKLPNIRYIGNHFMSNNPNIAYVLDLPNVETIGNNFLDHNQYIMILNLPKVRTVGNSFLRNNENIKKVNMPNLKEVGHSFLGANRTLEDLSLPELEVVGVNFLRSNELLNKLYLPKIRIINDDFMIDNCGLTSINFPNAESIGSNFLMSNNTIIDVNLSNVKKIAGNFMYSNKVVKKIRMDEVEEIEEEGFLNCSSRDNLESYFAPKYNGLAFDLVMSRKSVKNRF